jgi:hypothetical protein
MTAEQLVATKRFSRADGVLLNRYLASQKIPIAGRIANGEPQRMRSEFMVQTSLNISAQGFALYLRRERQRRQLIAEAEHNRAVQDATESIKAGESIVIEVPEHLRRTTSSVTITRI